jgi:hypothetical protein
MEVTRETSRNTDGEVQKSEVRNTVRMIQAGTVGMTSTRTEVRTEQLSRRELKLSLGVGPTGLRIAQ